VQCLKLLGSYNILSACVVGLSECACASYVAILDHTKHRDNAGSAGMCERTLYAVRRIPISCFMCLVPAGRPRTSTDSRHQATVTVSRCCRGLCRDIAIKKSPWFEPYWEGNLYLTLLLCYR